MKCFVVRVELRLYFNFSDVSVRQEEVGVLDRVNIAGVRVDFVLKKEVGISVQCKCLGRCCITAY